VFDLWCSYCVSTCVWHVFLINWWWWWWWWLLTYLLTYLHTLWWDETCTPKVSVLESWWTSQGRETQEHKETKPWQRNTGQQDELAIGGSCCTRQTRMATFGLWPMLHWERRRLNQAEQSVNYGYNEKALRETQTLRAGRSNAEPKNFAPPQTPFPGAQDRQNLISWRWSRDPVWWRSMHAISSYRGNRHRPPVHPLHTHRQDRLQLIHCAAAS